MQGIKYRGVLLFLKNSFFILLPIVLIIISEILAIFFTINPFFILVLVTLSSILSIYFLYKKLLTYSSYFKSKILLVVFSIFSLTITYLSNIYVNNYIVGFTHVKPSLFPLAQQLLFPFVAAILWAIFLYILLLVIFIVFILETFFDEYKASKSAVQFLGKNIRTKKKNNHLILNMSIFLGILITLTVVFPLFLNFVSSDYYKNKIIKKVFIISSYYLNNKKQICININEDSSIAFLNKDNISYINTTNNNMIFKINKCVKKSNKTLERNSLP